jgi:hypothetical protein
MDRRDIPILQKVGAVQREAFREKFPGQLEHCMRLTAERLQAVLTKRADTDPSQPATWSASARDIADLAIALSYLHDIQRNL